MTRSLATAAVLLAVGALYLASALTYEFGDLVNPRAGFFPTLVGIALVGIGGALTLVSLRRREEEDRRAAMRETLNLRNLASAALLVIGVLAYILVVNLLGFLLASAALMMFLMRVAGERRWLVTVVTSAVTSGALYWLFWVQMRVPIPWGKLWGG